MASVIPAGPLPIALWLFPWIWENDEDASPLLGAPEGAPSAQMIAVEQLEALLLAKLESRLSKLRLRHMALAARIMVANTILLGCIWYLLTIWAGKKAFL